MADRQEVKTIASLKRLNNSGNGNPTWQVAFTDGTSARTAADVAVAYELDNPEYRDKPATFTFNGRGQIVSAKPQEG